MTDLLSQLFSLPTIVSLIVQAAEAIHTIASTIRDIYLIYQAIKWGRQVARRIAERMRALKEKLRRSKPRHRYVRHRHALRRSQ